MLGDRLRHRCQTSELIPRHQVSNPRHRPAGAHRNTQGDGRGDENPPAPRTGANVLCCPHRLQFPLQTSGLLPHSQINPLPPPPLSLGRRVFLSHHGTRSASPRCHASSRPSSLCTSGPDHPPPCWGPHSRTSVTVGVLLYFLPLLCLLVGLSAGRCLQRCPEGDGTVLVVSTVTH